MQRRLIENALVLIAGTALCGATPYWVAYEGNDFPENEGWGRFWGDESGPYSGGAIRSIGNGALTLDSLHDDQIFDFYLLSRSIDPGPSELFIAEWRVMVDPNSDPEDQGFNIARDAPVGKVHFQLGPTSICVQPGGININIAEGVFHSYRFESCDMETFDLYVDGAHVCSGVFDPLTTIESRIAFGDGVMGQHSLATWDYVRFGVVPEPSQQLTLLLLAVVALVRRRTTR